MASPETSQSTRPSLLVRLRDPGDRESWQTFVETYTPLVYRYCRRQGLQDADAADVTQEVMAEVARCIRNFEYDPERGRFRDWLGTVTRRRLGRWLDRWSRFPPREEVRPANDVVRQPELLTTDPEWNDGFNAEILRVALERIRPHFEDTTWRAFERVWIQDRPAAEVAAGLSVPIETVYVAKSRVLKRLEAEVLHLAEDLPQVVGLG